MAVILNKTDGTVLTSIDDGAINTNTIPLTLIGRLYRNYGELVNENFIKLLENFANSTSPGNSIVGQLWYNTTTGALNVRRSSGYVSLSVLSTSSAQPNSPRTGDLWYDTAAGQLKMFSNNNAWTVISPSYTNAQAKTGVFAETIKDVLNSDHVCIVTYQQNYISSICCYDPEWTPQVAISGITTVKPGITLAALNDAAFNGTASNASALGNIVASRYLRNDINGTISGSLTLSNAGLKIGSNDLSVSIGGSTATISKVGGRTNFVIGSDTILSLDETGQSVFATGSALVPSISFSGDADTGIFNSGANKVGFSVGGVKVGEFTSTGLVVNGSLQASSFAGTLSGSAISVTDITVTGTATINALSTTGTVTLGNQTSDALVINSLNITAPNGLNFSNDTVTFQGPVRFADDITSTTPTLNVLSNLHAAANLTVAGSLDVTGILSVAGAIQADNTVTINSGVATGYANVGDVSLGSLNGIRSYNAPKMWVAFNGTLAGLAIYDSFHIDFVTRTSANNFTFTTEYPISSGAMAVVGTNGTLLTAAPSIGATSFSITTTSEGTRMALVVLSQ